MKILIKTHTSTYTLKNIKFEHHIAIFYWKITKLPLQTESLLEETYSQIVGAHVKKLSEFTDFFLVPPCTKSIYILKGHDRRDKKNWAVKNSKTLSFGDNWLYWDVH